MIGKQTYPGSFFIVAFFMITQYILAFFIYKLPGLQTLQWIGWFTLIISLVFGVAPIFILRHKGGVEKGKSYINTTRLVDSRLYAIVRHPQYLGFILFNLAMMLLAQHWLVILLGSISAAFMLLIINAADQACIEKFVDKYKQYMQRVPQINFLLGIYRSVQTKHTGN